jgi:hypothetical protein
MQFRVALSVTALVAALSSSPALHAAPVDHPVILPTIDEPNFGILIRLHAGQQEEPFIFDSGAGVSMITPQLAQSIGCHPWGKVTGFRMTGERVDTPRCDNVHLSGADLDISAPTAGVFDIAALAPGADPPLGGLIGLDMFAGKIVTIQPAMHRIVVETSKTFEARIQGATEVPIRVVRDAEGLALSLNAGVPTPDGMAWMELDTGNLGPVVVSREIAPLLGLDPAITDVQQAHFKLAGGIDVEGPARVRDLILDGDIGHGVLLKWDLTLDLVSGRAWFKLAASSG